MFNPQITSISELLSKLRAPRKDPTPDELRRPEALHIYGPFDGKNKTRQCLRHLFICHQEVKELILRQIHERYIEMV